MLLIVQIILTVWTCYAYNKAGQNWGKGLIPMAVTFVAGMLLGLLGIADMAFVIDIACIIWLGVLIATVKSNVKGD